MNKQVFEHLIGDNLRSLHTNSTSALSASLMLLLTSLVAISTLLMTNTTSCNKFFGDIYSEAVEVVEAELSDEIHVSEMLLFRRPQTDSV